MRVIGAARSGMVREHAFTWMARLTRVSGRTISGMVKENTRLEMGITTVCGKTASRTEMENKVLQVGPGTTLRGSAVKGVKEHLRTERGMYTDKSRCGQGPSEGKHTGKNGGFEGTWASGTMDDINIKIGVFTMVTQFLISGSSCSTRRNLKMQLFKSLNTNLKVPIQISKWSKPRNGLKYRNQFACVNTSIQLKAEQSPVATLVDQCYI